MTSKAKALEAYREDAKGGHTILTAEERRKLIEGLERLPEHVSVILNLEDGARGGAGLEALVDEVAEITAWCACVGIPMLSVYEKTAYFCPASFG
ncbi:hypothetical protein SS1G_01716 [Sclerotinia sclerotiorum 1980 UF-70]|uniref:Uncharacterized protein n=1 Tax=Sclerotinia sclerotiorum (strain ATCC 18683 / 1980 / Ss-1) TaxID=665079 RepID=A7E8T8_SCLS1|nr:hypothetical protein SS1G_01716 [Sclerotinia sclerotiorum 1980 UF-70]EDN96790.1 hypothetical protein SS1G_01716 [Sclerotinia sclerotiorum 1980 UF-70]